MHGNGRLCTLRGGPRLPPPSPPHPPSHTAHVLQRRDWLALVAVHSDSWLLALAFYKGARLNKQQRCGPARPLAASRRLKLASPAATLPHSHPRMPASPCKRRMRRCLQTHI